MKYEQMQISTDELNLKSHLAENDLSHLKIATISTMCMQIYVFQ